MSVYFLFKYFCVVFFLSLLSHDLVLAVTIKDIVKQIIRIPVWFAQIIGIKESCSHKWIRTNKKELSRILAAELLGQPIAHSEIPEILNKHWNNELKSSNLLLCFYGSPGTGKTFTTKILSNYVFRKGGSSYYYHFYSGSEAYINHQDSLMKEMTESIKDAVNECPFSIIVFDEADKYPPNFLDNVVLPFLHQRSSKAIFIFLTNVGSTKLIEKSLEIEESYFYSHNIENYNPVSNSVRAESNDSFYSSKLVQNGFIHKFIPYLPHKIESFIKCVEKTLSSLTSFLSTRTTAKKFTIIENILNEVQMMPPSNPIFVSSGCKRIDTYVLREVYKLDRLEHTRDEF